MKLYKHNQFLDIKLPFNIYLKCKIEHQIEQNFDRRKLYKHNYSWRFIKKRHETSNFSPMKYKHICYF